MRYKIIYFIIALFCLAALSRLVDLQLVHGDEYQTQCRQRLLKTSSIPAPRGDILDRNGRALVTNKTGFSIEIHYVKGMSQEERNELILKLIEACRENNEIISDTFPVSMNDMRFTISGGSLSEWKSKYGLGEGASEEDAIRFFCDRYAADGSLDYEDKRAILGVRYEMERTSFSENNPYTFAEDISPELLTKIKEQIDEYPGVVVSAKPVRYYVGGSLAAHILGITGKIYKEEYEELAKKNYSMNDTIGKQGIEKFMEDELRGKDGFCGVEQSIDGNLVKIIDSVAPVKGNNVVLTIDLNVQKAAEKALEDTIKYIRENSKNEYDRAGHDADSGAIAAIDVNTGELLALASYPPYDPAKFNEDYEKLIKDPAKPLLNRTIGGAYEPGSTFKMLAAIAALQEGIITPETKIEDKGIYKFYNDYRPWCWIYRSKKETHGFQNVSQAIENSCNYFFYEVGRLTGIDAINKYSKKFGLGEHTGIELANEENTGKLAGREEREKNGRVWNPGDTLQAAIGQSDNMFTPLQLANYLATVVNGGTRYRAHLVKTVREPDTGKVIYETKPEILETIDISEENYKAVMLGMKNVIEYGTASTVFKDFNVSVGGKTGTAEISGGSSNAIFVGFAPYDKPSIAVCCVIEHGAHGTNAGMAVREVLDAYFNSRTEPATFTEKNVLIR